MTRAVFENARSIVRGDELRGSAPRWRSHGFYRVKGYGQSIEIFEVGEEGLAPFVKPASSEKMRRCLSPFWRKTLPLVVLGILLIPVSVQLLTWHRLKVNRQKYYTNIALADQSIKQRRYHEARELLTACPKQFRNWEWGRLRWYCHAGAVESLLYGYIAPQAELGWRDVRAESPNEAWLDCLTFSPDSRRVLTVVGSSEVWIWGDAYRPTQRVDLTDLASLRPEQVDMLTVVVVGSSQTRLVAGRMVTPRGYLS